MSSSVTIDQQLAEEAQLVTAQLQLLHQRLHDNAGLARLVPYSIQQRGQRDRRRLGKLLTYKGPDFETRCILEQNARRWYEDPSSFGQPLSMVNFHTYDPLVYLASRIIQIRLDDS